jgi:hypothetical protein
MQTKAFEFLLSYFLVLTHLLTYFRVKPMTIESAVIQNDIKESNIKKF